MKIRTGFVSNSSSSSFIAIFAGDMEIKTHNYDIDNICGNSDSISMDIDEIVRKLNAAKAAGHKTIRIEFGEVERE